MKKFVLGDIHGRFDALKEVLKKSKFDYKKDKLIVLGDVADGGYNTYEVVEELLKIENLIFIIGNHDCLDKDTECLTKKGWKTFDKIAKNDMIYSYVSDWHIGQWIEINAKIVKDFEGKLIRIKNNHVDMLITPNHRILCKTKPSLQWKYKFAKNLKGSCIIPTSSSEKLKDYKIDDNLLKLITWILTDGSVYRQNENQKGGYAIYQSKKKFVDEIISLINQLGFDYSVSISKPKSKTIHKNLKPTLNPLTSYRIRLKQDGASVVNKYLWNKDVFPNWLYNISDRQFDIFLNVCRKADGPAKGNISKGFVLWGREDQLKEIQTLCHLHNYRATMIKHQSDAYYLNISPRNTSWMSKWNNFKTMKKYKGRIWCLNVPNGNFLVRRNGKVYFTGNCWFMNHIKSGWSEEIWLQQGGANTLKSYGASVKEVQRVTDNSLIDTSNLKIPVTHQDFFNRGLYYYVENEMLFVHGGIIPNVPLENQKKHDLTWDRELIQYAKYNDVPGFKKVFVGHTTTQTISNWGHIKPTTPLNYNNLWCLDTGAGWNGRLSIMNIDTEEYWQSKTQEPAIR